MNTDQTLNAIPKMLLDLRNSKGLTPLGYGVNQQFYDDPRRLGIYLARYKFVAKMLSGKSNVLEVGCGDAFGTRVVLQEVDNICGIDVVPEFIEDNLSRMEEKWKFECKVHDILSGPVEGQFDGVYSLDVLEHIDVQDEHKYMSNITQSMTKEGVIIIGMPSIQSQEYASKWSKDGHVNCKNHEDLKRLVSKYFQNVFIFSMNDEVVHTGFYPMALYLIALGAGVK